MNPPGKTSLYRVQRAAMIEAERIEISQDGWIACGRLAAPMPAMVERRDDFMGMVRLIDIIMSDRELLDRVNERMAAQASIVAARHVGVSDDIAIDTDDGPS